MSMLLRQLSLIPWGQLRAEIGSAEAVERDLRILLLEDSEAVDGAIERLENSVVSQGHLFQCAPAVVASIVAAIADGVIPAPNLAPALDLLGRIIAGYPDESEIAKGHGRLREACHQEALRGYWCLAHVAFVHDEFNAWRLAADIVFVLDPEHANIFLSG